MSGMTIAEKVLARASGAARVRAGDIVDARLDRICLNEQFERLHRHMVDAGFREGLPRISAPDRVYLLIDHYQPALNATQARRQDHLRALARQYGLSNFTDTICGVIHRIVMETVVRPGELGVCNDSHATAWGAVNALGTGLGEHDLAFALVFGELWFKVPESMRVILDGRLSPGVGSKDVMLRLAAREGEDFALYRSLEFTGPGASALSMDDRTAIASHAVEVGAKFGVFDYDAATEAFLRRWRGEGDHGATAVAADADAEYCASTAVDLGEIAPQVALPARFGNVADLAEVAGEPVTQAVIGSCANGMLDDLAVAASILRGRRIAPGMRFFIQPASWGVWREANAAGHLETLLAAGAQILQPGCHLCQGRQGALSDRDVCVTSTTRNHRGRMGDPGAQVYLASSATVAASALAGRLADPREYLR